MLHPPIFSVSPQQNRFFNFAICIFIFSTLHSSPQMLSKCWSKRNSFQMIMNSQKSINSIHLQTQHWPQITVELLCLFPGRIINSIPFTPKVINWDEKLHGYYYKISQKPMVVLISNSFPKPSPPYLHNALRYACPYFSSLSNCSFSLSQILFLGFLPNAYFFPKALLSLPNPRDDEYFLKTTHTGFLYFGLGLLL